MYLKKLYIYISLSWWYFWSEPISKWFGKGTLYMYIYIHITLSVPEVATQGYTFATCTGAQSLQVDITMIQTTKEAPTTNIINPNWILLNTCSTTSSIRNKSLVQNIQPCDAGEELMAYTNHGHQDYDHTATFKVVTFWSFFMNNPLQTYHHLPQWSPSSGSSLTLNWTHSSTYTCTMAQG